MTIAAELSLRAACGCAEKNNQAEFSVIAILPLCC